MPLFGRRRREQAMLEQFLSARTASLTHEEVAFGEAWLAAFDNADADTLLKRGAGIRGPVYLHLQREWMADAKLAPSTYLRARWLDVLAACAAQPRCPTCGTTQGLHPSYCPESRRR